MRHKLTGKQRINIKIFGHKKISGHPPASACTWWRVLASWDASSPRAANDIKCTINWAAPNYRRTIPPTPRGVSAGVAFWKLIKPGIFGNFSNQYAKRACRKDGKMAKSAWIRSATATTSLSHRDFYLRADTLLWPLLASVLFKPKWNRKSFN